jgi:serine beta-lactamase-like protein LACTB, mitochondrial
MSEPMNKNTFVILGLLMCLPSQLQAQGLSDSQRVRIDHIIKSEMDQQKLVGAAVALIKNKEIVYVKGFGFEDRRRRIPVTKKTLFRWASISKPVTAVAALQLWEQGRLDLDADIRKYVPEFPARHGPITSRQLLCHQGGIVHYANGPVIKTRKQYGELHPFKDVINALDKFKESPLVAKPGARFSYTTHGYILLSAVVQRAGQESFAAQVEKRVITKLRMKTMRPDYQWETIPNRAVGYKKLLGKIIRSSNTDVSWKLGGGGFISNVEDLARFAQGLMKGQLLAAKTRSLAWVRQKTSRGSVTKYGFGFSVSGEGQALRVGHTGAQEKTRTSMAFYPRQGFGIVVMTNSEYGKPRRLSQKLWRALKSSAKAKLY